MQNELQLINHIVNSKSRDFMEDMGLEGKHFRMAGPIYQWVDDYNRKYDDYPSHHAIKEEFVDYEVIETLDAIPFLVEEVIKGCAFQDIRQVLVEGASTAIDNPFDTMHSVQHKLEELSKQYGSMVEAYDWVGDAKARYELYMETHGEEGIQGVTYGIPGLDELTGGIVEDDFVLVSARLGEGKSLMVTYISYHVWLERVVKRRQAEEAGVDIGPPKPILIFSTEMGALEISYRLDTMRGHFSNTQLSRGELENPQDYKDYLDELSGKTETIKLLTEEDNNGRQFTVADIERIIHIENPCLVIIDQIYDINDGTGERDIRKRIVNSTKQLRSVNLYTNTPMVVVAQAGREAAESARRTEGATPEADQIQESDAPAQRATKVITLKLMSNGILKLSLKKNRGGPVDEDLYLRTDIDRGYYGEVEESEINF